MAMCLLPRCSDGPAYAMTIHLNGVNIIGHSLGLVQHESSRTIKRITAISVRNLLTLESIQVIKPIKPEQCRL